MRVGILGGTFDPPHIGHLAVALDAAWALRLDRVLWMVAGDPWQKTAQAEITPAEQRMAMVEATVAGHPRQVVSRLELLRDGPSYTADTLLELRRQTADELVLLLGADAARNLPSWHRAGEIAALAEIAVFARNGDDGPAVADALGPTWPIRPVDAPELAVSSSDIRHRAAVGRPIEALVAPGVCSLIRLHGLYGVVG